VYWVAHSQGCAISVAAFAANPTLAQRVTLFVALAPVTYLKFQTSSLMSLMRDIHADTVLNALPASKFICTGQALHQVLGVGCRLKPDVCDGAASALFGKEEPILDPKRTGVYFGHFPDGTSNRNIAHWVKNFRSGDFANAAGVSYDLSAYRVKTHVFCGSNDVLGNPLDVRHLVTNLGANVLSSKVMAGYAHMDFTWAPAAATAIYQPVIALFS